MGSPLADTTESLPYGFAKDLRKACDAALDRRDPKGRQASKANSSHARTQRNALRAASEYQLLQELLRRQSAVRRRNSQTQRQREFRERQRKSAALVVTATGPVVAN